MVWLKYYEREFAEFPEACKREVSIHEAELIAHKLVHHFKITLRGIEFHKGMTSYANLKWRTIDLGTKSGINVAEICHELAHLLCQQKYNSSNHTKKLMTQVKRLINYCMKNEYWGYGKHPSV